MNGSESNKLAGEKDTEQKLLKILLACSFTYLSWYCKVL